MAKILLIDGYSILFRSFFGIRPMTNSEGIHTNAIYGFLKTMFSVIDEENPDHIAVAFDRHEKTFRHEFYAEYKAGRKKAEPEFLEQVPLIQSVLTHMNISVITKVGFEADDILGTMATVAAGSGMEVTILSGDRDLLQIATDRIKIRIPKTKASGTEVENYYAKDVESVYGVDPDTFIELKALMGDSSDNIKGAPGIGEKTGLKLLLEYKSIDGIYEHIDELKGKMRENLLENKKQVYDALFLVTIKKDVELEIDPDDCEIGNLFTPEFYEDCVRFEFKSFLSKFDGNAESQTANILSLKGMVENSMVLPEIREFCSLELVGDKELSEAYICDGKTITHIENNGMLVPILEALLSDKKLTVSVFDLKKQMKLLPELESIKGCKLFDIKVAAFLNDPLNDRMTSSDIANRYLKALLSAEEDVALKNVYTAFHAYEKVLSELNNNGMYELYRDIEAPLIPVLYDMEKTGIGVDVKILDETSDELLKGIASLENEIYELAGEKFNINSPKALGEILFEKLSLSSGKKTKTGYSTSADVLEKIKDEHPIIGKILEYRTLFKLYSTYASALKNYIAEDGRIHTTFNQTITATGRISSTEPNLQNIPARIELGRRIRKAFVAKNGYSFVDADYSQVELRIMAHMSGDKSLIEAYNSAMDIHSVTASKVFGVPVEEVTPIMRRSAKAVNFGIIYGISAFGLGEDLNISRKEAKEYIERFFESFPGIKDYLDKTVSEASKNGYVKTLYNRVRPVPDIKSTNMIKKNFGERVAMNSPIQGTAADIMKIAMINVHEKLKGLDAKIILQIHDEILIEAKDEIVDEVKELLIREMENAAKLQVPLMVSASFAKDWYSVK